VRFDRTAFADAWQFHLRDDGATVAFPEPWPDQVLADRVLAGPGAVAVRAAKNWFVPVTIEVVDAEPSIEAEAWDHIVIAELALPSGRLVLGSGQTPGKDQPAITVPPGTYRLLLLSGNLDRTAPEAVGDDYYKAVLWPGSGPLEVRKRWVAAD
jgi:hypothetical protein